ncbi:MAG: MFS transporter [Pseudomonadota bacterium]|nr:MFS transporter [Pseudomonadota bacterium]
MTSSRRALISWAFYDWASSAFATMIQTFVFATYLMEAVIADPSAANALWGQAVGLAGLIVALTAPVLGAIADRAGRRKPWLIALTVSGAVATVLLWSVKPDPSYLIQGLLLVGIGTVSVELAVVFYNAMLADLVEPNRIGRWSGWAWGLGYLGGLACLVIALFGLIQADPPPFGLDRDQAEHVRATFVLAGVWYLVFSLPLFFFTPDQPRARLPLGAAIGQGLKQLGDSLRHLGRYGVIIRFLIARMFFIDGLTTVFAFGGIYAAGSFGLNTSEVMMFAIVLNLTAGIGAGLFAWLDDLMGSRNTIVLSLIGLLTTGVAILTVESTTAFWVSGTLLGLFVGPAQAASRSYLSHVAPTELRTEMFGLMAFSGKTTAFLGPMLVGWLTWISGSPRIGLSVVLIFFLAGLALMLTVPNVSPQNTTVR